jgi:hypothetical protein
MVKGQGVEEPVFKFSFLSVAQVHSLAMDRPVSIVFGPDNMYWVVSEAIAQELHRRGFEFCQ